MATNEEPSAIPPDSDPAEAAKVDLLAKMSYLTRFVEYKRGTRGCSKRDLKERDRAVSRALELLLGRKPTTTEIHKVNGDDC